jgi:rhodanese-related sulfurtransferase
MLRFNEQTSLETLERVFPAFLNFAPSTARNPDDLQQIFSRMLRTGSNISEFCNASQISTLEFLERVNASFANWLEIEIDVLDFKKLMFEQKEKVLLVDVREKWESEIASFEGSLLFSQGNAEVVMRQASLTPHVIIFCHHGIRSLYAASYFRENGVAHARSLRGGIDAYSEQIDGSLARY